MAPYPMYTPALESIETVNVVTNSFDAERGLASAAAVNIQTKTGSNAIHGSLFEDHTDRHLKAYACTGWTTSISVTTNRHSHHRPQDGSEPAAQTACGVLD